MTRSVQVKDWVCGNVREGRGGEEGSVSTEPTAARVECGGGAGTLPEGLAEEEEL